MHTLIQDWLSPAMILALAGFMWRRFERLDSRIDRLESRIDNKIDHLDEKIDKLSVELITIASNAAVAKDRTERKAV